MGRGWLWTCLLPCVVGGALAHAGDDAPAAEFVWFSAAPRTLDPALTTGQHEMRVLECLFEGLTRLDGRTLEPLPAAARSWSVSPDGLRYTFTLREDACWSNGDPVRAEHFVEAWMQVLDPGLDAPWASQFDGIRHARAFREKASALEQRWPLDPGEADGLRVLEAEREAARTHLGVDGGFWASGPHTLTVELTAFMPYFPSLVAHAVFCPRHPDEPRPDREAALRAPRGNGPYVMEQAGPRDFRFVRSGTYRGDVRGAFETLELRTAADPEAFLARYQYGEGDWLPDAPLEAARHADAYREQPALTYYYWLNTTRPHLRDPRVRRALALAVDRAALCAAALPDHVPSTSLVAHIVPASAPPASGPDFDVGAARALLQHAGYDDADGDGRLDGFPVLTLIYNTNETHQRVARAVAAQWSDHLGVQVRLDNLEWWAYQERLDARDYDVARAAWIGDHPDPNTFLDLLRARHPSNRTDWFHVTYQDLLGHIDDPAAFARTEMPMAELALGLQQSGPAEALGPLDDALGEVRRASTEADRLRGLVALRTVLQRTAERVLAHETPVVPLARYRSVGLVRPSVAGFHPNALQHHPLRELGRR